LFKNEILKNPKGYTKPSNVSYYLLQFYPIYIFELKKNIFNITITLNKIKKDLSNIYLQNFIYYKKNNIKLKFFYK